MYREPPGRATKGIPSDVALQLSAWFTHRAMSAPWLAGGVLVSILAATVQVTFRLMESRFTRTSITMTSITWSRWAECLSSTEAHSYSRSDNLPTYLSLGTGNPSSSIILKALVVGQGPGLSV